MTEEVVKELMVEVLDVVVVLVVDEVSTVDEVCFASVVFLSKIMTSFDVAAFSGVVFSLVLVAKTPRANYQNTSVYA
jgi:hypothetical protein